MHRIASLNAFIGCTHAGEHHTGMFLICQGCGNVLEMTAPSVSGAIKAAAEAESFALDDVTLEIAGLCPRCQSERGEEGKTGARGNE